MFDTNEIMAVDLKGIAKKLDILEVAKESSEFLKALDDETTQEATDIAFAAPSESIMGQARDMLREGDLGVLAELSSKVDKSVIEKASRNMGRKTEAELRKKMTVKEARKIQADINAARVPQSNFKGVLYSRGMEKMINIPTDTAMQVIHKKLMVLGGRDQATPLVTKKIHDSYTVLYLPPLEVIRRKIDPNSTKILGIELSEFIIIGGTVNNPIDMSTEDVRYIYRQV